jgi:hypothetical protein
MKTKQEIEELFELAREMRVPWVEFDGIKMPVPQSVANTATPAPEKSPELASGPGHEFTDEEILFWSTPYFDEMQAVKELREKHAQEAKNLKE